VKVENYRAEDYIAISYTWSKRIEEWRDQMLSIGARLEGSDYEARVALGSSVISTAAGPESMSHEAIVQSHLFFTILCFLVITRGKDLFWMDILCIDQEDIAEKEYFVPRMGDLYGHSAETHAYLTGCNIMTTMACDEFHSPIWETRAWTLQEHIHSKNVLFCYAFYGDATEDIKNVEGGKSGQPTTIQLKSPLMDRYTVRSLNAGFSCVLETTKRVTCYMEQESWTGGLPLAAFLDKLSRGNDWNGINEGIGRGTFYKTLYSLRHGYPRETVISTSMMMLGSRRSARQQDMMYSILGILGLKDYKVSYGIEFEECRLRVFEAIQSDVLTLTLGTEWGCNRDSANKDSALPRVLGSEPTIGIELTKATAWSKYTRDVGTTIYSRIERFRIWKDVQKAQSKNLGVVRATMGSETSRLMIMYCVSLLDDPIFEDVPISAIPSKKVHTVILGGSRISDEDYLNEAFEYDRIVDLLEIGVCTHHALFVHPGEEALMRHTALLTLECETTAPGNMTNKGTVLVLDASSLSGHFAVHTVQ